MIKHYRSWFIFIFLWIFLAQFSIVSANTQPVPTPEVVKYTQQDQRDPFQPLMTGKKGDFAGLFGVESVDDIALGGIVIDPSGSLVLANGVVLQEGEITGHIKVVEVREDGVVFSINEIVQFKPFKPLDFD